MESVQESFEMLRYLVACGICFFFIPGLSLAENVTERSVEVRTSLGFRVPAPAVQKLLPAGWTVPPSTDAANSGRAIITVTMMERLMVVDAKGQPFGSGTSRYVVVTTSARNADGKAATFALIGISPEAPGSYDIYLPAVTAKVERSTEAQGVAFGRVRESWEFATGAGEKVALTLQYRRGRLTKTHSDPVIRSGRHAEFQRTYHIDQASEVLRGPTSAEDHVDSISFKASGGAFSSLFDDSSALVSVTSIPWYYREITVP
jgi:hypothetical protein